MEPLEPMRPTAPMRPMEPMRLMEPMEPLEPMKPMRPMEPMELMTPMEPMRLEINPMQYCQYKGRCRLQLHLHLSRHLNPFHPAYYIHQKWCRKIDANRQWHPFPP